MKNRFESAVKEEKAMMNTLTGLVAKHTGFKVSHKELKGEKGRIKYNLPLKANNPHIHLLEFNVKGDQIVAIRLTVSRPTIKGDFYKAIQKAFKEAKFSYGGILIHIEATSENAGEILTTIDKLAVTSPKVELDPHRTYCDPPKDWIEGITGREGVVKKSEVKKEEEVKAPEAKKEEVKAPSAKEVAQKDIKKAM